MKKLINLAAVAPLLVALAIACAPAPIQPSSPPAPAPTAATPPVAIPVTQEDSAWAKVLAAAKKEGKVTAYTYNFTGAVGMAVAKAFARDTGLEFEVLATVGTRALERIKAEQLTRQYVGDVFDSALSYLVTVQRMGYTEDWGDLPALRDKDVFISLPRVGPDTHGVQHSPAVYGPFVNTNMVKPGEEPKSWYDFLEPRWKSKIVTAHPYGGPNLAYIYTIMKNYNMIPDPDDYFSKLGKQDLKLLMNAQDVYIAVARGEFPLSFASSESLINKMVQEGAPMRMVPIKEGVAYSGGSIVLIKNSPHPNATRVWANWLFSKEGQIVVSQARSLISVRKDVPDFTPPAARLDMPKFKLYPMNGKDYADQDKYQSDGTIARLIGVERK